jgi:hypothetical protein
VTLLVKKLNTIRKSITIYRITCHWSKFGGTYLYTTYILFNIILPLSPGIQNDLYPHVFLPYLCKHVSFLTCDLIDWLIISMGCDYVSELWPPTGLLFILQVIYEHEKQWLNVDMKKILIRPPERSLAILPAQPSSSKQGSGRRKLWIFFNEYPFQTHRIL